jgi:hypothetical protein
VKVLPDLSRKGHHGSLPLHGLAKAPWRKHRFEIAGGPGYGVIERAAVTVGCIASWS